MYVVDTCGWIEWLTEGLLAEQYAPYLTHLDKLVVPTLVQFELYKWCLRERDEAMALEVIGMTESCRVWPLDTRTALTAADLAAQHKLAMADALVYATALSVKGELLTSDSHFAGLPQVRYWAKEASV